MTISPLRWLTVLRRIAAAYMAGGASVPAAVINSSIHVLMYGYYFVAALGPEYRKYLGWKRYLTRLQGCIYIH